MIKKMRFLAVAALLVIAPIESAISDNSDRENVEKRVRQYMDAWKRNDIEAVWDMMSPRLKRGNDASLTEFRDFTMKHGFHPSGYKIEKITINDDIALVESETQYSDFEENILGSEREELGFIKVDDVWYFDKYRVIHP